MSRLVQAAPIAARTPRERLWAAMRELRVFTRRQLLAAVNKGATLQDAVTVSIASDYLASLVRAGILCMERDGRVASAATYVLAKDVGVRAPRVRKNGELLPESGRTRMWRAAHVLRQFGLRELVAAASLPGAAIALSEADGYCRWLVRAGYLLARGKEYVMVPARYTGPKAPQILRIQQLYDPNLGKVVLSNEPEGRDDL